MTEMPTTPCPGCGHELTAATSPDDESLQPKAGDLTVCVYCTAMLRFDKTMHLESLTQAEVEALEPEAWAMLRKIRAAIRQLQATKN